MNNNMHYMYVCIFMQLIHACNRFFLLSIASFILSTHACASQVTVLVIEIA